MTHRHTGACQCGAVTYEALGDPIMIFACHCTICQRQSGAAFGMAVVFDGTDFTLTCKSPAHFVRPGHGRPDSLSESWRWMSWTIRKES